MTQVRVRRPPSPQTAPLLSANGAKEEGVTKARALSLIRAICPALGPGSHPGRLLQVAIQGPAEHNQESLQDSVFTVSYESDPVLSDTQNAVVYLHVAAMQ